MPIIPYQVNRVYLVGSALAMPVPLGYELLALS